MINLSMTSKKLKNHHINQNQPEIKNQLKLKSVFSLILKVKKHYKLNFIKENTDCYKRLYTYG
jgi:hypothetical protein